MKSRGETPRRADAARNRERVLRIAREQLTAGDESLQLNTIARLAGVGVGTVYRHFPGRNALLEAISHGSLAELTERAESAAANGDPLAGLHELLRFALTRTLAEPGFAGVLGSPTAADPATAALKSRFDKAAGRLLRRAKQQGQVHEDLRPADLRRLLAGITHALRCGPHPPRVVKTYLRTLQNGLRPS
ncbi:TetR/AcrR family transcriptional regulator [Amycolatopsis alkalitolerans]|uniref:TetR/AcrR family transcriptional regulator n=1 Tax=Amycolatopsis alkalitolerans TaxID=2547244 RepID=UPI0013577BB9|nr:TetR/AcrR family transcriptional regulator [Amycolatopsis alkalitolerans]